MGIFGVRKLRSAEMPAPAPAAADSQNVILMGRDDSGALTQVLVLAVAPGGGGFSIITLPSRTVVDTPGHGFQRLDKVMDLGGQPLLDQTVANLLQLPIRYHVDYNYGALQLAATAAGQINFKTDGALASTDGSVRLAAGDNLTDPGKAVAYLKESVDDPAAGPRIQASFYLGLRDALASKPESERRSFARQLFPQIRTDLSQDAFADLFVSLTTAGQPFNVRPLPVTAGGSGQSWYFEPAPDQLATLLSGTSQNSVYSLEIRNGGVDQATLNAVSARLAPLGFSMAPPTDQSGVNYDYTQIKCGGDALGAGSQVQTALGKGTLIKDDSLEKQQIIVIIGKDMNSARQAS